MAQTTSISWLSRYWQSRQIRQALNLRSSIVCPKSFPMISRIWSPSRNTTLGFRDFKRLYTSRPMVVLPAPANPIIQITKVYAPSLLTYTGTLRKVRHSFDKQSIKKLAKAIQLITVRSTSLLCNAVAEQPWHSL